jgi:hypothetical protein
VGDDERGPPVHERKGEDHRRVVTRLDRKPVSAVVGGRRHHRRDALRHALRRPRFRRNAVACWPEPDRRVFDILAVENDDDVRRGAGAVRLRKVKAEPPPRLVAGVRRRGGERQDRRAPRRDQLVAVQHDDAAGVDRRSRRLRQRPDVVRKRRRLERRLRFLLVRRERDRQGLADGVRGHDANPVEARVELLVEPLQRLRRDGSGAIAHLHEREPVRRLGDDMSRRRRHARQRGRTCSERLLLGRRRRSGRLRAGAVRGR